jgi:hypothetical protein
MADGQVRPSNSGPPTGDTHIWWRRPTSHLGTLPSVRAQTQCNKVSRKRLGSSIRELRISHQSGKAETAVKGGIVRALQGSSWAARGSNRLLARLDSVAATASRALGWVTHCQGAAGELLLQPRTSRLDGSCVDLKTTSATLRQSWNLNHRRSLRACVLSLAREAVASLARTVRVLASIGSYGKLFQCL